MEVHAPVMDHPKKRRRRRRNEKHPIPATIVPDADIRGEEGLLSVDLYEQLLPWVEDKDPSIDELFYIAVSPWVPQALEIYHGLSWTILPVRVHDRPLPESGEADIVSTVRYPASSPVMQAVLKNTRTIPIKKDNLRTNGGIRILVLDVQPVRLSTVYLTVDGNALQRHEEIQKEFGGGFGTFRKESQSDKGKGKGKATVRDGDHCVPEDTTEDQRQKELTDAIRSALVSSLVVRQGGLLPLPLPAHPITHVPLPPAEIILCEPVNQGLLSPDTKIVVVRKPRSGKPHLRRAKTQPWTASPDAVTGKGDDTSNEQFFSAIEEGINGHASENVADDASSDSHSPERDSDSGSGESMDDIISLSTPSLTGQATGTLSSFATTPRARDSALNGASTPGSMYSNFTVTTSRQHSGKGRLFRACALAAQVPTDFLYPKPSNYEDDESRVLVDVRDLQRLKCFSGDWVRLRTFPCDQDTQPKSWDLNALHADDGHDDFRMVRIYGLPNLSPRLSFPIPGRELSLSHRRSSVATSTEIKGPASKVWLSPILHANIEHATEVQLSPMMSKHLSKQPFSPKHSQAKSDGLEHPPIAAEVSLAKISTPLSQEAAMQDMIFSRLKQYFETKRRSVKAGDLIAMTVDITIGRLLGPAKSASDNKPAEELLSLIANSCHTDASSLDVVWFKVGQITTPSSERHSEHHNEDTWGGIASVDPLATRMTIGANQQCKVPSNPQSSWKSYLGLLPSSPINRAGGPMSRYISIKPPPYTSTLQRRLRELVAAATSQRATALGIDPTLILLYSTQRNIGKAKIATQAASDVGIHTFSIDAHEIISEGNAGEVQESSLKAKIARGLSCGPQYTTILLRHVEALTSNRMINVLRETAKSVRTLIATTTQLDQVPENMRSLFTHEIDMSAPDEGERRGILHNIVQEQGIQVAHDVDLSSIAVKTAALVAGNLVDIVERAVINRQIRLENFIDTITSATQPPILIRDLLVAGGEWARCVTKDDFNMAVDAARKNFADAIGAPKIPNVSWDDVGGLEHVKDAVMETIQLPLERPELFAKGMKKRSGILFYGPPGTGKTLLAKAIATEFSLNFFSVKGPELLNMYIGESEANVRRVFQRARDARPCVVFFDELDSVAPKRGNQGDSGGVMDRIVSQLLAELDGMSNGDDSGGGVFVIGATNRPDLLDQALLRPGRFDKMLYLGISDTHQKQLTILEALTRKFTLDPELSLARVADSLPFTYTGADLYALCSDAMLKAITRQASAVDEKIKALPGGPVSHAYFFERLAKEEDVAVCVSEEDFHAARRELVGSVR